MLYIISKHKILSSLITLYRLLYISIFKYILERVYWLGYLYCLNGQIRLVNIRRISLQSKSKEKVVLNYLAIVEARAPSTAQMEYSLEILLWDH